jgi:hypothetical protein
MRQTNSRIGPSFRATGRCFRNSDPGGFPLPAAMAAESVFASLLHRASACGVLSTTEAAKGTLEAEGRFRQSLALRSGRKLEARFETSISILSRERFQFVNWQESPGINKTKVMPPAIVTGIRKV